MLSKLCRRFRSACRTNEPQVTMVVGLTLLNGVALLQRQGATPVWLVVSVLAFWPALAFLANLVDPIPPANNEHQKKASDHAD